MPTPPMIRLESLRKSYRGRLALEGLSLEVGRGEIFGLLGHNGAGKSTAFGLTLGHLRPDSGEAFIAGHNVQRQRHDALRRVGAIFEAPAFYDYLSGWRNLGFFVNLTASVSTTQMESVVKLVGLEKRIHDPVRTYSHGMRQRLGLAQALLPNPEMILLDEPTEGLDPEGIHEIRELIRKLRDQHGLTVLLSSHLLSEVERLCDRVAILHKGKMVFCGAWREAEDQTVRFRLDLDDWARAETVLAGLGIGIQSPGVVILPKEADSAEMIAALVTAGIRVREAAAVVPSLEDFYLRHAGS